MNKKEQLKKWVDNWKETGEFLENLRREEIRRSSTQDAVIALSDSFLSAISHNEPKPTSGLIEQRRLFGKLNKK